MMIHQNVLTFSPIQYKLDSKPTHLQELQNNFIFKVHLKKNLTPNINTKTKKKRKKKA